MFTCLWLATLLLMWLHGLEVPPMVFVGLTVLAMLELIALIEWRPRKDEK